MSDYNLPGFVIVVGFAFVVTGAWASRRQQPFPVQLVMLAILARVFGTFVRYQLMLGVYGRGDAIGYYEAGLDFARQLWRLDLSPLAYAQWFGGFERWWGTRFIENLPGLVITFVGPSMLGECMVFALASFAGLYCITLAFHRLHPGADSTSYAQLVWLWPSLVFLPSAVGKESVTMLAIGLVTLGYVGRRQRVNWIMMGAGLLLAFAIRPHVAGMLVLAAVAAHWLGSWQQIEFRRVLEGLAMLVIAGVMIYQMQAAFGLEATLESWESFYDSSSDQTLQGGGNLGQAPTGPLAPFQAIINIWMRPFVWEVHNLTAMVSALEILLLWFIVWMRRRNVRIAFKDWRHDRLLRFGVPLVLGYTVVTGMAFANLGIIARQRALAFPFVLLPLCAVAASGRQRARSESRAQAPPPLTGDEYPGAAAGQAMARRRRPTTKRWQQRVRAGGRSRRRRGNGLSGREPAS